MADEEQPTLSALDPEVDLDPDWKEAWRGMPSYDHKDLQPWQTIMVHFQTEADRESFGKLVGQPLSAKTKFIWHPKAEIRKASDKVWTSDIKVIPRYPVYIISKGRADTRLTSKAFEWLGIPYHIVVEPQEYNQYAAVINPEKILVTPFSNLGQGGIPARNFVWEHSIAAGAERHWIFDDNISGFCRFHDNLKVEVDSGILHKLIEDFVDRYENMAMAAFNYDYFAPRKQGAKIKPITLNTRCYSGILLSNKIPHRWRGRYNEDTDLSLRILKDGLCTVLFNAFLMYKKPTLTMKGGNTDQLYAGVEATAAKWEEHAKTCADCTACLAGYGSKIMPCEAGRQILSKDGRWLMAESLREQHPDQTTVERKWRRWQHQVDYRRFDPALGKNELILKPDIQMEKEGVDELMTFDAMPQGWGSMGHDARNRMMGGVPTKPTVATPTHNGPSALDFALYGGPAMPFGAPVLEAPKPAPASPSEPAQPIGETIALEEKPALAEPSRPGSPVESDWDLGLPARLRMAALDYRDYLLSRGHKLLTRDGKFFVSDSSTLTEDERRVIKDRRDYLIELAEPWVESPTVVEGDVAGVSRPSVNDAERTSPSTSSSSTSFFDSSPTEQAQTLAQFLGSEPPRVDPNYVPDEPPDLAGIDEVVLNFATDGLDWAHGNRPVGVTVSTLDGQLTRFLPFKFRGGGNLSEETVKRWAVEQLRGKRITGANTRFEVHMAREWGVDLEEQGNGVSDVMHYAALLDDHRKRFALDVLVADFLPNEPKVERLDERDHAAYAASEVAARERYTAQVTAKVRNEMWPLLDLEDLQKVRQLEDDVIYPVVEMEKNGALLNLELLEQYSNECIAEHASLMMEIGNEAGFSFDHTAKGWQRLFEKCGVPPSDSYAEDVIGDIEHPLIKKAHFAAQIASLNSKTFAAYKKQVGSDGILRYDINQLRGDDGGTVSGRFSIGYVQQVPNRDNHTAVFGERWFPRRLFISSTGTYLEADAAQIEYRLGAHHAENEEILKAYANEDPSDPSTWVSYHRMTWEMIKRYKPDMLYSHQKSFNFARQYGAKMVKLAVMMGFITKREGDEIKEAKRWHDPRLAQIKEIEAAYTRINPEGDKLLDRASHLAKSKCDEYCKRGDALHRQFPHRGYVKTLEGRRSRFPHNYKTYIGLNRVLQGTGADIMKRKLVELHRVRKLTGFLMRLTVHDAAGGDAQDGTKQLVSEVLNKQSYDLKVKILWDVKTGKNWAECK